MCRGLFESETQDEHRHAISINRGGKERKIQDTPKEDNILCTFCEKRIGMLEAYFSNIYRCLSKLEGQLNL